MKARFSFDPPFPGLWFFLLLWLVLLTVHQSANAIDAGSECSGDYVWRVTDSVGDNVSSMADIVLSEAGEATVLVDLDRRKIPSTTSFYVDSSKLEGGDGLSAGTAFKDLREAFDTIGASSTTKATINVAAGVYRWGDISNPKFSFNIIGQGPGVTLVEHDGGSADAYAAQVRVADVYIEGITFSGGEHVLDLRNMSKATVVNCEIKDSPEGNGLNAVNVTQLLVTQTTSHHNFKDGFNYHNSSGGPMEVLEFDVEAFQNGQNEEWNSQGSTIHDTVKIVRVNSLFYQNPTNIADVNESISYNINLESRDARSAEQEGEYLNYNVGTSATAWIIGGEYSVGPVPSVVHSHDQSQLFYVSNFNTLSSASLTGNSATTDNSIIQELVCEPSVNGPSVCPDTMPLGDLGSGLAAQDLADGMGYLLWSSSNIHDRLYPPPDTATAAQHLIAVVWDGTEWLYDNNESYYPFEIESEDCLIAEVDFGADTVSYLKGEYGTLYDIGYGYSSGDLQVSPNQYKGVFNVGEFGLDGTAIFGENNTQAPSDDTPEQPGEPADLPDQSEDAPTPPPVEVPAADVESSGGGALEMQVLALLLLLYILNAIGQSHTNNRK